MFDRLQMTTQLVSAFVSQNQLNQAEFLDLIRRVHDALGEIEDGGMGPSRPSPAVPAAKSVEDDYIVCLEDGKKFKSLKRHLRAKYNLTPEEYREKWGLPEDYPMVAPSYARKRSRLAKEMGLGRNS